VLKSETRNLKAKGKKPNAGTGRRREGLPKSERKLRPGLLQIRAFGLRASGFGVLMGLLFFLAAPSPWLGANPLKEPKRVVSGRTADLAPLFHWWTNHAGARPLVAWVHVTGSIVGTNVSGWILEAQVETTERTVARTPALGTGSKIILRNPPLQDRAEFDSLLAQLKLLNAQHDGLANVEDRAKKDARAAGRAKYRARQDKQVESEAKAELRPLDRQIQDVKTKLATYPNAEHYSVDCFALDTGQAFGGMAVFDHGLGR
jgi:outer membrane murein-binding lipoprotein Lpp